MRAQTFSCLLLVLAAPVTAQIAVPEIAPLRDPYLKNLALIRTTKEQRAAPITAAYLAAVERLEKQVASDPFAAAPVKAERERVAAKREPLEQDRKEMPTALAELRARYDKDIARVNAPYEQQEHQMTRQYITALDALQRRLTSQNLVAKAAAVRAERVAAAATLPKEMAPRDDEKEKEKVVAESTIGAARARAVGAIEPAIADKISGAVSSKSYSRSENSGQEGETKGWEDQPEGGGLLVGFEFFEVGKDNRLRSLRPYFLTKQGVVAGKDRGKMEKVTDKVMARNGYAVAGLMTSEGKHGMQVIFMKIDPASGRFATDSASTYKSVWFGDKGREKPKQIGGDGRLVIGVYGKTGADCDDIGLVQIN